MGGGSSAQRGSGSSSVDYSNTNKEKENKVIERGNSTAPPLHTHALTHTHAQAHTHAHTHALPYLDRDHGDDTAGKLSRDRFKRVLDIVRKEAMTLDALNTTAAHARRKRQMSNDMTVMVQQEQEEQLRRRRLLNDEREGEGERERESECVDEEYDSEDELLAARDMLFGMIGYELSSSEDESEDDDDDDEYDESESEGEGEGYQNSDVMGEPQSLRIQNSYHFSQDDSEGDLDGFANSGRSSMQSSGKSSRLSSRRSTRRSSRRSSRRISGRSSRRSCKNSHSKRSVKDSGIGNGKEDDVRSSSAVTVDGLSSSTEGHYLNSLPRCSSEEFNKERAKQKKKQHELHSIMRQESLAERKARARRKLARRKQHTQLRKIINATASSEYDSEEFDEREKLVLRLAREMLESGRGRSDDLDIPLEDEDAFEARKNVVKEFKAYDRLRRSSEQHREGKQRESLIRRLEERKRRLAQEIESSNIIIS